MSVLCIILRVVWSYHNEDCDKELLINSVEEEYWKLDKK